MEPRDVQVIGNIKLMALKITKNYMPSYTLREIFEDENPALWDKVQALSKRLADLQEMVIPVLPLRQQQLHQTA